MTRLSDKLRLSAAAVRFLSLNLAELCKSLAAKAFSLFSSMDFSSSDNFDFWDNDRSELRSQRPRLLDPDTEPYPNPDDEKVYLVPYRWWKEVQRAADAVEGVAYDVSFSDDDDESEIVMNLRKIENGDCEKEGFSGCEYALVTEPMWVRGLIRHGDLDAARKEYLTFNIENILQNVFPLQIKLFISSKMNSLVVKICEKDNSNSYARARSMFSSESKLLHIWDFSGKITKLVMNESLSFPSDSPGLPSREYLLQLQVHGLTESDKDRDDWDDEMAEIDSNVGSSSDDLVRMNGSTNEIDFALTRPNSSQLVRSYVGVCSLGLIGLQNLGNTCFMNSAIQCLVHTPELVDYFLGDYCKEINSNNPLGMKGDLAIAFGELLRKLWTPGASPVAPRLFKQKIADFAPQFSGYNQHDSQEFLSFLLDGLHEDLNRVKCKLATKAIDIEGRPDDEVAGEHWKNHVAQNDSIIVNLFHGQYRSTVACSICNRVSLTFDPFVYLSLPLPSTTVRTMTLTVLSTDGKAPPCTFTITVPQSGRLNDLMEALSIACSLNDDEILLVAEIYKNQIFRTLEDPNDSLSLIRNDDCLVAYRLPRENGAFPLVEFIHQRMQKQFTFGGSGFDRMVFGIPLVARLSDLQCGFDLRKHYMRLLNPFSISVEHVPNASVGDAGTNANEDNKIDYATSHTSVSGELGSDSETGDDADLDTDFQFYIRGILEDKLIEMNDPVLLPPSFERLKVYVLWSDKMTKKYDTSPLSSLPVVFKSQSFLWSPPQDSVSLCKCLDEYLKEEPLGDGDMWYCPECEKPQQANKKLDFWKLPEVLVIHLKRFSYTLSNSKLERYVEFPIDDLDFSTYLTQKNIRPHRYNLYAIINHHGSIYCGHYTAFVRHGNGLWYEFNDDKVCLVSAESIKTSAAYLLFYRRVPDAQANIVA